jgi:hypothetical protein
MRPFGLRVYMTAIAMLVASLIARRVVPSSQTHSRARNGIAKDFEAL